MEANFGQDRLWKEFDDWCDANDLQRISHHIKKIYTKENKNLRIEQTETPIESGKVLFPDGQDMVTLKSQFLTYPDGYIDGCDAVAWCLERFESYGKKKGFKVRTMRR